METLRVVQAEDRPATPAEQGVLARWTSWGALPGIFDERDASLREDRATLRAALTEREWSAAKRTVLNAHYTDPRLVDAVWTGLDRLGFTGGPVLEPGSGVGSFIGLAPGVPMVGIELDPTTAQISQLLYPQAVIRNESFADTRFPSGSFEAAVGNVPFGDVSLHDRLHNPGNFSIHNHFIRKSLDAVRPGGMVAVLTSRYTMDSLDSTARKAMHDKADLVTAVRLPSGAHWDMAGTEAVTDLVILRVRPLGEPKRDGSWIHTVPLELPTKDGRTSSAAVNSWWDLNPGLVLGRLELGHGQFSAETLLVRPFGDGVDHTVQNLQKVLTSEAAYASENGLTFTGEPADPAIVEQLRPAVTRAATAATPGSPVVGKRVGAPLVTPVAEMGDATRFEGFIANTEAGFTVRTHGASGPLEVPKAQERPLQRLVALRDTTVALLEAEARDSDATDSLDALRAQLNRQYDEFVKAHGPINQMKISTSSRLDRNGDPIVTRRRPAWMTTFRTDPFAGTVLGLEDYDESTGQATKAAIFTERVVNRVEYPTRVESPDDALSVTLDVRGFVDLEMVAGLLDTDEADARRQLGELVFDDPASGRPVPRAEYLSGDVRAALRAAEAAAVERPELMRNVQALQTVIPRDLTPSEIRANLGASWIPASDVQDFLRETLNDRRVAVEHPTDTMWVVRGGNKDSVAATAEWGTTRMDAITLTKRLMEQKPIVVHDVFLDAERRERRVVNAVETAAAQDKAVALAERFNEWVWSDPERATRLGEVYNNTFNAVALRDYTEDGRRLRLPGLVSGFTPREHQRTAIARIIAEPSVGLYHGVGAGKTAEMVIGAMELRRLGLVEKPAVAVPNHMLEQVTREWIQLYPRARVLAASSEDLRGPRRAEFIGRAATGNWDAVILTHGALKALPVDPNTEIAWMEAEVEKIRTHQEAAKTAGLSNSTVKQVERMVLAAEERLKKKADMPRDGGLTFEQSGIDYLMVDELHLYKNLTVVSNIQEMNRAGSARAVDLDLKLHGLRERAEKRAAERGHGRARVMTGATATPIANSVSEAWVMQKYLRPDLLEAAGVSSFDAWAATFGTLTTELEMTADGGFRQKARFARFDNLPELLRMWHISGDVKMSEDLNLPVPLLTRRADGVRGPETVVVPASPELEDFMMKLAERAEQLRNSSAPRGKGEDNMLVVTSDGRKAALDLRMLDRTNHAPVASTPGKADVLASRIWTIWEKHRNDVFPIHAGSDVLSERRGGLQIVFGDLGTPGAAEAWSFYGEVRKQLVARGMDGDRIKFVQDANSSEKKARLFAACRSGQVDVLFGSTETMGVGTNVQLRAVHLHHADAPWRPADVEQREGRAVRQGNHYEEIGLTRYVTERSFDAFMWQTLERKQKFIGQVMRGTLDSRGADDVAVDQALSFNEVKALATGNPLILERAEVEATVAKLERQERAHARDQQHRQHSVQNARSDQVTLERLIPQLEQLVNDRTSTAGEDFRATVRALDGRSSTSAERVDAAEALAGALAQVDPHLRGYPIGRPMEMGHVEVGSVQFSLWAVNTLDGQTTIHAALPGLEGDPVKFPASSVRDRSTGPVTRLENAVAGLDARLAMAQSRLAKAISEQELAQAGIGADFQGAVELARVRQRLVAIDEQLKAATDEKDGRVDAPDEQSPGPAPVVSESVSKARAAFAAAKVARTHETSAHREDQVAQIAAERDRRYGRSLTGKPNRPGGHER